MKNKINFFFILFLFCLCACNKKDNEFKTSTSYQISGMVEKGPFVSGSKINIYALDDSMTQIGVNYSGNIINDEGEFDFGKIELTSPYIKLSADGYYFNEVRGKLSTGPISLDAVAHLKDQSSVNVNILTHLKRNRILKLLQDGKSFDEANAQAQKELFSCFSLQQYADADASTFSITAGTNEAAALIVISSIILKDKTDAELTEYLAKLSEYFEKNGTFSEDTKTDIWEKSIHLSYESIKRNIVERYNSLGKNVDVKDLRYFIDWDHDGIAGNELGNIDEERILSFGQDTLLIAVSGGNYQVQIQANIPFTTDPVNSTSNFGDSFYSDPKVLFKSGNISCSTSIEDNKLILDIEPAALRSMNDTTISIYSMDGQTQANLVLVQKGDPNKSIALTEDGISLVNSISTKGRQAINDLLTIEGLYTQCYPYGLNTNWEPIYDHTESSSDNLLYQTWASCYQELSILRQLKDILADDQYIYTLSTGLESIIYYELAVYWGNVIYVQGQDIDEILNSPQLTVTELFDEFENDLKIGIDLLPSTLETTYNESQVLFYSKDVLKGILAKMYMYTGDYNEAYSLLQEIIQSGNYALNNSRIGALSTGSNEFIYVLKQDSQSEYSQNIELTDFIPIITYSEIIMLSAECAYHLGNTDDAINYYNIMAESRSVATISSTENFISNILSLWKTELKGTGTYFAFLKRNDLAESVLNIPNYRLLLPFPQSELNLNPNLIQNPGY